MTIVNAYQIVKSLEWMYPKTLNDLDSSWYLFSGMFNRELLSYGLIDG